jgi:ribulose-5-phosphate 4-epimerase/fuculose-1-phosphate aldolase
MSNIARFPERQDSLGAHWQERVDLAAAFRWTARLDMHEGIANHFSLAVSDDGARFLVNPYGRHFSRVRASDLMLVDANNPEDAKHPDMDPTAWAIHGALHRQLPRARCLMHVHSKHALVLATLKDSGMPPIDQNSMRFYERVAIDDGFDGMGLGEEAERLPKCLGDKPVLVMGNHGVMVTGPTVAETFDLLYYFERACETLITAYMTGRELRVVSDAVARKTRDQWEAYPAESAKRHFAALKDILDEEEPAYRQ